MDILNQHFPHFDNMAIIVVTFDIHGDDVDDNANDDDDHDRGVHRPDISGFLLDEQGGLLLLLLCWMMMFPFSDLALD